MTTTDWSTQVVSKKLSKQLLNLNKFSLKSRDPGLRDKKSLEMMEQIDYNFSKSEKAKGTQKRAAIGNLVFDPDSQCCLTDRPQVRSRGGKPRNCRSELIHN